MQDENWRHQGFTVLWDAPTLGGLKSSAVIVTIRQLMRNFRDHPSESTAVVATGLDGVIDALAPEVAETWLGQDLRRVLLEFQDEFESQRALVLWLPTGRARIKTAPASDAFLWRCGPPHDAQTLPFGRILWSGAETDVARLVKPGAGRDAEGADWIGLHLRRIS